MPFYLRKISSKIAGLSRGRDASARLCKHCRAMFKDISYEKDKQNSFPEQVLHQSSASLAASLKGGCQICRQLPDLGLTFYQFHKDNSGYYITFHDAQFYYEIIQAKLIIEPLHTSDSRQQFRLGARARSARNTGDGKVSDLVNLWMQSCLTRHRFCQSNANPARYPTRLLDIEGQSIRLIDTGQECPTGAYATVSYCWGQKPFRVLTSQNLDEFSNSIQLASLPPALQNAVAIARRLLVRYIWIDSFCIIQSGEDAAEDKQREIGGMHDVYANAILNIAASFAASPFDDCFVDREFSKEPIQVMWQPEPDLGKDLYSVQLDDLKDGTTEFARQPLFTRAWVLQELLLCTRVLYLAGKQVYWECNEVHMANETFLSGRPHHPNGRSMHKFSHYSLPWQDPDNAKLEDIWDFWQETVHFYTSMNLSHPTDDKLAAIGGIARKVAALLDDEYVVGGFQNTMAFDLLWKNQERGSGKRASVWRAPSWSWASMDTAVRIASTVHQTERLLPCVEIVNINVDYIDSTNPYGGIKAATLEVRGKLLHYKTGKDGRKTIDGVNCYFSVTFDDDAESIQRLSLLRTQIGDTYSNLQSEGLVLRHVESSVYARVGTFIDWKPVGDNQGSSEIYEMFESQEAVTVRLV